jgi:hypothetical protein
MLFKQSMTLNTRPLETAIGVRCSREERAWFRDIAAAQGLSLSDAVRAAMALEATRLGVAAPATATAEATA